MDRTEPPFRKLAKKGKKVFLPTQVSVERHLPEAQPGRLLCAANLRAERVETQKHEARPRAPRLTLTWNEEWARSSTRRLQQLW